MGGPGSPSPYWATPGIVYLRNDNLVLARDAASPGRPLTDYDRTVEHAIQPTFDPERRGVVFTHVLGTFGVDDRPGIATLRLNNGDIVDPGLIGTHPRFQP